MRIHPSIATLQVLSSISLSQHEIFHMWSNIYVYLCTIQWKFTCRLSGVSCVTSKALVNVGYAFIHHLPHHWSHTPMLIGEAAQIPDAPLLLTVCSFGDNLLSWYSKRQPTLSRSSAEAEYRGVAYVVYECSWLHNLLLELHFSIHKATMVYSNKVSAICLSGNPVQHQRTKPIEMDIHFVREKVADPCFSCPLALSDCRYL